MVNTSGKEIKSLVPGLAAYAKAYFSNWEFKISETLRVWL
jgi:hypothetical protein